MRVSNYLLWQIAYAEIYVTETLWPDFRRRHLLEAVLAYQKRERRYGGITSAPAVDRREMTRAPQRGGPRRRRARGHPVSSVRRPARPLSCIVAALAAREYLGAGQRQPAPAGRAS